MKGTLCRTLERPLAALLLLVVLALASSCGLVGAMVDVGPGEHLSREAIMRIISEESPVYYRDGKTRIGVFFDQEHRQYVKYEQIPTACVDAIVAAEDENFWSHKGVDPWGVARALWVNLKAGGLVAGGSTITQQTAKNLYYRPDRSLRSKLGEAVNALRLERRYSKKEILEFYLNQFHVSSNGRGIGIAARYFFDKDVGDLSLQECAFLAGLVKAPSRYNPWIGRTEEERKAATDAARLRTVYVLRRMRETGRIDADTFTSLAGRPIPFKRGAFHYERSVVLDTVEERLAQAPFPEILAAAGIDNPSTAGLQVVTTLDAAAQSAATWGLWHHLTELGGYLEGAGAAAFALPSAMAPHAPPDAPLAAGQFFPALVVSAKSRGAKPEMVLDLGGSTECRVDGEGLLRAASVVLRAARKNYAAKAGSADVEALVAGLPQGSVVWASVRSVRSKSATCDLEIRPRLQGAVVVLDHGEIRALVGGNDNRNFNRVTDAKRQFGSTWKPLLYDAAFQLGWLPTDPLDNRRAVFFFEGTPYFPRPDHVASPVVSLAWAGTHSENVASIWLLYHLVDRLNAEQTRRLAELVDLAPRKGEGTGAWARRLRDERGIQAGSDRLEESLFAGAVGEVVSDLAFSGHPEDASELRSLLYGREAGRDVAALISRTPAADRAALQAALDRSFLHLQSVADTCRKQLPALRKGLEDGVVPPPGAISSLGWADGHVTCSEPRESATLGLVFVQQVRAFIDGGLFPDLNPEGVRVDDTLWLSSLDLVRIELDREKQAFEGVDPWDPRLVYRNPDFRRLLGMRYLARLARAFGVETDIPAALSIPLGAADASLLEMADLYQGFLEGASWRFEGRRGGVDAPDDPNNLIQTLLDRDGKVLYEARRHKVTVADATASRLTADILRNVVLWGTGRRAREAVTLGTHLWPVLGKTGTTNGFKNAAFVGYAPVANGAALSLADALTVAVYVGYDDNKPMQRGTLSVAGASGALPAWLGTVKGLAQAGLLGDGRAVGEAPEIAETGDFERVSVDETTGLPIAFSAEAPSVLVASGSTAGNAGRRFAPFSEPPERVTSVAQAPGAPAFASTPPPARGGHDTGEDRSTLPPSLWDAIEGQEESEKAVHEGLEALPAADKASGAPPPPRVAEPPRNH
jgi:penicillin-binding protein 1A